MEEMHLTPPMIPSVQHDADTRNFDAQFTKLPPADFACDPLPEEENRIFRGFSFHGHDHSPHAGRLSRANSGASPRKRSNSKRLSFAESVVTLQLP